MSKNQGEWLAYLLTFEAGAQWLIAHGNHVWIVRLGGDDARYQEPTWGSYIKINPWNWNDLSEIEKYDLRIFYIKQMP